MPNPDILYQPGAQGGGTLTTNAPQFNPGQMQPPPGFDLSWLQQLAERRAAQEANDREMAQRRMVQEDRLRQRMLDQQETMMQRQRAEMSKPRGEQRNPMEQEIWVDPFTGQPTHAWIPGAMNTHRTFVPQRGEISHGKGVDEQQAEAFAAARTPHAAQALATPAQRWEVERGQMAYTGSEDTRRGGKLGGYSGY